MFPILLIVLVGGIILVSKSGGAKSSETSGLLLGLPDILPDNQHGVYKRDYDDFFYQQGLEFGVPFALMKAHAIRESSLKPGSFLSDSRGGSYGLMQLSWGPGNERFKSYGYSAAKIGDGQLLYDPYTNTFIAAQLIADNLRRFGNVKDAINAYNTGVAYSTRVAPANYTEDVLNYYSTLIGRKIE